MHQTSGLLTKNMVIKNQHYFDASLIYNHLTANKLRTIPPLQKTKKEPRDRNHCSGLGSFHFILIQRGLMGLTFLHVLNPHESL